MFRYLTLYIATALAVVLFVAAFNLVIDPYRLFGTGPWFGINQIKPHAADEQLIGKALLAENVPFEVLILGNSRSLVGFDPESQAFKGQSVLNLALAGRRLDFVRHFAKHALAFHKPKLMILGVDFTDFLVSPDEPAKAKEAPAPPGYTLSVNPEGQPQAGYLLWKSKERLQKTVSLKTLINSFRTVLAQHSAYPEDLDGHGFTPLRDYLKIAADEGYYKLFKQREVEAMKVLLKKPKTIYWRDSQSSWMLQMYADLVALAKTSDIQLITIIYPYHADYFHILEKAGLLAQFEDWKRQLVDITADSSGGMAQLWDFSGYSHFTTEEVPAPDDKKTQLRWYWESGHFKKELGDQVLARVLEPGKAGEDFGVRLTAANIEAHLERLRHDGAAYKDARPEAMRRVDSWLEEKP